MNEDEKEILKAGADAAMKPFANLMKRLFGGATEELGGMWQDSLKARRYLRRLKLLEKVQAQIDGGGFEPRAIPDSLWVPVMHEALLQDDDNLHAKWASLLANAADPRKATPVLPVFATILKDLTAKRSEVFGCVIGASSGKTPGPESSYTAGWKNQGINCCANDGNMFSCKTIALSRQPTRDSSSMADP